MQEPAALLEQQLGVERLGGSGDTGVFLVRSGQVQAFFDQHPLLRGAPLLTIYSKIRDTAKSGGALIRCVPAPHVFAGPASAKRRRVSDTKQLTQAGESALSITARPKRGPWARTVVWRIDLRCRGSGQCDRRPGGSINGCSCQLAVTCSTTVAHVHSGFTQIVVAGQHSTTRRWNPTLTTAVSVEKGREIAAASLAVGALKADRNALGSRQSQGGGGATAIPDGLGQIDVRLQIAQETEARLKLEARPYHSQAERDEIERLYAEGQQGATAIRALLFSRAKREYGEVQALESVPTVAYVQSVLDNRRSKNRSRKPVYEAIDELNRTVLADERIWCVSLVSQTA